MQDNTNSAGNLDPSDKDTTRFYSKVTITTETECWPFNGCLNTDGYGVFHISGRTRLAHRVAYEIAYGQIPLGLTVDHTCNNPSCVRFEHLEAVTQQENIRRAVERRTHCGNGHEWTPENTYPYKGGRRCRACGRAAARRYYQRKKAERLARDLPDDQEQGSKGD